MIGVNVNVGSVVPGPGGMGVLVGGRVGVAVTRFTGITSNCPTKSALGSVIAFSVTIASWVLLNFEAIPATVSPGLTMYSIFVPRGRSGGIGVAVGNGAPGAGSRIVSPGMIFCVVGSMPLKVSLLYGLSNNIHGMPSSPRLNFSTIEKRESPASTM